MERRKEDRKRENVIPVQKPTNEGRGYPERCIQVKRGKQNRPREKKREGTGDGIKKDGDRGKVRDRDKGRHVERPEVTSIKITVKFNCGLRKTIVSLLRLRFAEVVDLKKMPGRKILRRNL